MEILLFVISGIFVVMHCRQSNTNDEIKAMCLSLKSEVDKLRMEKLKFKKGDYVTYNGTKCFISNIDIDRTSEFFTKDYQGTPYRISGPNLDKYVAENCISLLKCKKDK